MTYPGLKLSLLLPLLLLALTPVSPVYALSGDRQQPIHIDADRMIAEQPKGYSHYIGNVHITQGSLKIDADEVYVYLVDGLLNKLIIIGSPAKLQQLPDNSTEIVYSRARRMEYYASTDRLLLMKDAEVWQGGNHFSGEHIEYDTRNSRISANSEGKKSGRVRAVIVQKKTATNDTASEQHAPWQPASWQLAPWQSAPWQPTSWQPEPWQLTSPQSTSRQPASPQPASPQPASPQPVSPQPASPQPASPQPASPQPASPQPVSPQPVSPQPVSPQPASPQPVSRQPASPQPASWQSAPWAPPPWQLSAPWKSASGQPAPEETP